MDLLTTEESISPVSVTLVKTRTTLDNITGESVDCEQVIVAAMSEDLV
jgi:hypothetical protein